MGDIIYQQRSVNPITVNILYVEECDDGIRFTIGTFEDSFIVDLGPAEVLELIEALESHGVD